MTVARRRAPVPRARPAAPIRRRRPRPSTASPRTAPAPTTRRSRAAGTPRRAGRGERRLAVAYDVDGPRVRLGLVWFGTVVVALLAGRGALALVYAGVAGVAGLQSARCWRRAGRRPHRLASGALAAALPAAAAVSTFLLGVALLALAGAAFYLAVVSGGRRSLPLVDAGYTVQCALLAGMASAGLVLSHRFETGAAVALVLMVSAYEAGDYLVGSGGRFAVEGPLAGAAAILVVTFAVTAVGVNPFEFPTAFGFGAMAAVLCPLGQLLGSAVLPGAAAPAPALRRLDSLLLLGPAWAWIVGAYAAGAT